MAEQNADYFAKLRRVRDAIESAWASEFESKEIGYFHLILDPNLDAFSIANISVSDAIELLQALDSQQETSTTGEKLN